jgi:ribose-phosphate pyrophosphokinase
MLCQIEDNVRESDCFFIQTSVDPVSDHIIESCLIMDALRSSSASRITSVFPYFPYVRSDKKDQPRISIAAKLMGRMFQTAGASRFLVMDLHAEQIQGFFDVPVDQLLSRNIFCEYIRNSRELSNHVLVAPDVGESKHLLAFSNALGLPMAIIDKRRFGNTGVVKSVTLIGDVAGKHVLTFDDEIASGSTLISASDFLKDNGAKSVCAFITHGVLCGDAYKKLSQSSLDELVITDTIPAIPEFMQLSNFKILSVAPLFAEAIKCIHFGNSITRLFK